jgi:hypothetical protein
LGAAGLEAHAVAAAAELVADAEVAGGEVDVAPDESECFGDAQAAEEQQRDQGVGAPACGFEQGGDLRR